MNTLDRAKFRILVYKSREGYKGICYETGWVEIQESPEEVLRHIENGIIALLGDIKDGKTTLETINRKPFLGDRIVFHALPPFTNLLNRLDISIVRKSFNPVCFA